MAPGILDDTGHSSAGSSVPQSRPTTKLSPSEDEFLQTLSNEPYAFLRPSLNLHNVALVLAKTYLDSIAASVTQAQEQRLQAIRRKRKRGDVDDAGAKNILRLKQIHLEGFDTEQVWEQARRVLDANRQEIERSLPSVSLETLKPKSGQQNGASQKSKSNQVKMVRFDEDGFAVDSETESVDGVLSKAEDLSDGSAHTDLDDLDNDGQDVEVEEEEGGLGGGKEDLDRDLDLGGAEDIEEDDIELNTDSAAEEEPEIFVPDKHGLNDGFFSIDDFNRTSQFLEQQDGRGDIDDGAASDEEDIDWDADPTFGAPQSFNGQQQMDDDSADSGNEVEDGGPTFGNADLNAPNTDSEDDSDADIPMEDTATSNTNDIKYSDFFAPPPLPAKKSGRRRPLPKTQPPQVDQLTDDDIQRTISAVRRDLFEDDEASHASDVEADPNSSDVAPKNLSTHQKRQAALAAQIRTLEAAAVAKRTWTLSGEARAADRPLNSLLEEDLDFERAGKPVPVVTAATSEDLEALIKRRILSREFDEVIRRRPDTLNLGAMSQTEARRGAAFELEVDKDPQSLAEIYETEHLKKVDPEGHVDKRDAALQKSHKEIERLWADLSAKLDALSNWHYRPKPADVSVSVVGNVAAVRMEDARPGGVSGVAVGGEQSMLAPQEVYKAGEERRVEGEVVTTGGGVVGKAEMSREEKLRRRRREKERKKKSGGEHERGKGKASSEPGSTHVKGSRKSEKTKEKDGVVADLKKAGVKVIGKKGELMDVEGKTVSAGTILKGGGGFKL